MTYTKKNRTWSLLFAGAFVATLTGATPLLPGDETPGDGGVPGVGEPGGPSEVLTLQELRQWLRGRAIFDKDFTVADGLGTPELNADSCRGCHMDPVLGGAGGLELNVSRFGHDNGGLGPFMNLPGGQGLSKLRPPTTVDRENYPPEADVFEQRQTPSALGLGLLDGVSEAAIKKNQDKEDRNNDGIFGYARIVMIAGQPEVGRFGWKAQAPRIGDFANDAMGGENGITTPDNGRGFALLVDDDLVPDPEIPQRDVDDLTFFMKKLGAPIPAGNSSPVIDEGEELFTALRCDRCHVPSLPGEDGEPLWAYTNLLVHNVMGPGYRGMEEPDAPAGYFRTPPLWGIKDTAPYMHDGRAENLSQAVLAHHGEAEFSSRTYALLPFSSKLALVEFLKNL